MGEGGNEEGGMHHTTLVRTALFVLCAACRYSAADRDRTGDYRLEGEHMNWRVRSSTSCQCAVLVQY